MPDGELWGPFATIAIWHWGNDDAEYADSIVLTVVMLISVLVFDFEGVMSFFCFAKVSKTPSTRICTYRQYILRS